VNAGNIRAWSIYNLTAINRRHRRHRQLLLQPAWRLRGLLPDPFVRQVVALAGMSVDPEGSRQMPHVRISVWIAC
jgi:hypothetical protein